MQSPSILLVGQSAFRHAANHLDEYTFAVQYYCTWSLYDPFGRSYATGKVINIFLHSLSFSRSEQPGKFLNRSDFFRDLANNVEWSET